MANRWWSYNDTTVNLFYFITCSIIIERAINLRRDKILRPEIIQTIEALRSQEDIPFAISKCEVIPGPLFKPVETNPYE